MKKAKEGEDLNGLASLFPKSEQAFWQVVFRNVEGLTEVRLRAQKPALAYRNGKEFFLGPDGRFTATLHGCRQFSAQELSDLLLHLCKYSLYAYEEELREGYLTLEGGHRLGVAGQIAMDHGRIQNVRNVAFLNFRLASQIMGAADEILPLVYRGGDLKSTLIVSPPGCGKTTLLRDLIRQVSNGNVYGKGLNVGVVDERSEIGGSHLGVPQNDLGLRTDVLCGCPKALGMRLLVRTMSPDVIAVDELGKQEDLDEIREAKRCGVRLLATLHGKGREDVIARGLEEYFDVCLFLGKGKPVPILMDQWERKEEGRDVPRMKGA